MTTVFLFILGCICAGVAWGIMEEGNDGWFDSYAIRYAVVAALLGAAFLFIGRAVVLMIAPIFG